MNDFAVWMPCRVCGLPVALPKRTHDECAGGSRAILWPGREDELDYDDRSPELGETLEAAEELSSILLAVLVSQYKGPRKQDDLQTEGTIRMLIAHVEEFQRLTDELLDLWIGAPGELEVDE